MKPSTGRIVHYHVGSEDRESRVIDGEVLPAMVIRCNYDGSVNLKVFNDSGVDFSVKHSFEGEAGGRWSWPPRE